MDGKFFKFCQSINHDFLRITCFGESLLRIFSNLQKLCPASIKKFGALGLQNRSKLFYHLR
ncbi:hypothetical protein ASC83_22720 [Acidovorax sp. Root402]|nr:hypothetical protein ASC83_22720 [Acidovorax sp. Root402]